jgi:hypothetical protein
MTTTKVEKQVLCDMLRKFIAQRSGIDFREYGGDRAAFMSDYRPILQHGRDARRLLEYVENRDGITADDILSTTSGNRRLEWVYVGESPRLEYCTGQYFPTEYRAAACSMLAGLVWRYLRDGFAGCHPENGTADAIRQRARRLFGRGLASRWFA